MRTKTLLLAAALSAAGIAASVAQSNVYSLNVVGYVNISAVTGFNLIANPLDLDGTGTNNTATSFLGTNLPAGSRAYAFNENTGTYLFLTVIAGAWSGSPAAQAAVNAACNPGGGVFLSVASAQTVTAVGNVEQGSLTVPIPPSLYAIKSSKVPQAGLVQTDLGLTPVGGARIYQFLPGTQAYGAAHTFVSGTTWGNGQPNIAVGEAFFMNGGAASSWTRNFTVQ